MRLRILFATIIFTISLYVQAADTVVNDFQLSTTLSDGTDVVRLVPKGGVNIVNPGCPATAPDSYFIRTTLSGPAKQRIFATLLSAKMSGKPVLLSITQCEGSTPAITSVALE